MTRKLQSLRLVLVLGSLAVLMGLADTSEGRWRRCRGDGVIRGDGVTYERILEGPQKLFKKPSNPTAAVQKSMTEYDLWYICAEGDLVTGYVNYWVKVYHGQVNAGELPPTSLPAAPKKATTDATMWHVPLVAGAACRISSTSTTNLTWNTIGLWGQDGSGNVKLLDVYQFRCYQGPRTECGTQPE